MSLFDKYFDEINFNHKEEFKDAKIEKIVVDKLENTWTIYMINPAPLNPELIYDLKEISYKGINECDHIYIKVKNESVTDDEKLTYFKFFLNKLAKTSPSLNALRGTNIFIKNDEINIEVANKIEESLIKDNKALILNSLSNCGISLNNILPVVNEIKGKKIREEIERVKNGLKEELKNLNKTSIAEVKQETTLEINPNVVFGNEFTTRKITSISELTDTKRNICIKAYITSINIINSRKSNYKIFNIEVADENDNEFVCKLFTNDDNVYNSLRKNLLKNNYYYFKGSVTNDDYLKDLVFTIRHIMKTNEVGDTSVVNDTFDFLPLDMDAPDEEDYNDNAFFLDSFVIDEPEEVENPIKEEIKKEEVKEIKEVKQEVENDDQNIYGYKINEPVKQMIDCDMDMPQVCFEAKIFDTDFFESTRSNFKIVTLKITDYTDSFVAKIFTQNKDEFSYLSKSLKKDMWIKISGSIKYDDYAKDLVLTVRSIEKIESKDEVLTDDAKVKRIELHTHTKLSQMDGIVDVKSYIKTLASMGYKGCAITDHNSVQAFPDAFNTVKSINKGKNDEEKFKVLYGCELLMIEDSVDIVKREVDLKSIDATYCVFDIETTGFNAGGADSIIEIGAVLIKEGKIVDRFDELINPGRDLPKKITDLTGITDEMLKDKDDEETVVKAFLKFAKDCPLIAHNAKFDTSFIEIAMKKYNLGELTSCIIDTLELSRALDSGYSKHSLSALVKRYNIEFDEDKHHRADYDAEATALIFDKMLNKMYNQNIRNVNEFNTLVEKNDIYKFGTGYHINVLVKNQTGLKNLFKLISYANTKYLYKTPRILRSEVEALREGLLIGSGCYKGEIFVEAKRKDINELSNLARFYDYIEVQPLDVYNHLIQTSDFLNEIELENHIKKILEVCSSSGVIAVATGDVHHFKKEDKIYREIIINQKVPGGGRHDLAKSNITFIPSQHFRTTDEMLDNFKFLDKKLREEIVITNPLKIFSLCDEVEVIKDTGGVPFAPRMENSVEIVKTMVYEKAKSIYGDPLPDLINERVENELSGIIKGGYDVIYLIAQKLVEHSNSEGYLVGSRGSVGSSFVASMMGITEINPLPAHYICSKCKKSLFEIDGKKLSDTYTSGYDLPDYMCPDCGVLMNKEGQDMPFATFLGFNADKVPDIDLNFSGDNQASAHEYTKVLFGEKNVYRAGIVTTVADKTAYGFVKGYLEDKQISKKNVEVERLAKGVAGAKRTTGQHPGGIVVIPDYMDVFDFTPYQYPADDKTSAWQTTHFDFHSIEENVLKLDILGHDNPTVLKMLQDLSGIDVLKVPLDDKKTMSLFSSCKELGVKKEDINCETGTLGVPEFGTSFVIRTLLETKPKTFAELVKISGLSHGTDVWTGNARDLILNNVVPFKDIIGCRDDIMNALIAYNMEPLKAFKIMEFVRKGKASKDKETWEGYRQDMIDAKVPSWFIESCGKIKYMFPKAHAAAYVVASFRIAWFKVHKPIYFYASYYSIRVEDFDIEVMCKGYDAIKKRYDEILEKGRDATQKEKDLTAELQIAMEMCKRGFNFKMIDLYKSDSKYFIIDEDEKSLIFPFRGLDGLGATVAKQIVKERSTNKFLSIEDLQVRAKINQTTIDKMRYLGILDGLSESNQLSLFD